MVAENVMISPITVPLRDYLVIKLIPPASAGTLPSDSKWNSKTKTEYCMKGFHRWAFYALVFSIFFLVKIIVPLTLQPHLGRALLPT